MVTRDKRNELIPELRGELEKYCSVSICCTDQACSVARALARERCLIDDAPELPLAGCDSSACNCTFVSHRDRRDFLSNRRSTNRLEPQRDKNLFHGDRRAGVDRRSIKVDFKAAGR